MAVEGNDGRITNEDAHVLMAAAIVGVPELAAQLVRLGISSMGDSLEDAAHLRPAIFQKVERLRGELRS